MESFCTRLGISQEFSAPITPQQNGKEFENSYMESFCTRLGISQEFSTLITPQQNGVVERKKKGYLGDGQSHVA